MDVPQSKHNNKITHLHQKCFRLIYSDKSSLNEKLLERDGSVSIYHKNIYTNPIHMFKNLNGMSWEINNDLFVQITENCCNLYH